MEQNTILAFEKVNTSINLIIDEITKLVDNYSRLREDVLKLTSELNECKKKITIIHTPESLYDRRY